MNRQKRWTKWACGLTCCVLACGLLAGCGGNAGSQQSSASAESAATGTQIGAPAGAENAQPVSALPETEETFVTVETPYGNLYYPDRWQEDVTAQQTQEENTVTVTFETTYEGVTYNLFEVYITDGERSESLVGTLTDGDGAARNVYLHAEEIPEDSAMDETEQNRLYAMQEDLNYLIDNLK